LLSAERPMIDALVGGRLHGKATERIAKKGNTFATCVVRATCRTGETVFISVIAFNETAVTGLLALNDGDSVTLAGELTPKVWTSPEGEARPSLDLVAHQVLTTYAVKRKRQAIAAEPIDESECDRAADL
jgi:single-stranded DNA-binding protein